MATSKRKGKTERQAQQTAETKKRKRVRKTKAYSKKAKAGVEKNYAIKLLPLFEEVAARFAPVDLSAIPALAPYIETVEGEEVILNLSYRAYPQGAAAGKINRTIGCCRVLHNKFVEDLYAYLEKTNFTGGIIKGYKVPLYPAIKDAIGKDYMNEPDATAYANVRGAFELAIDRYNKEYAPKGRNYTKRAKRRAENGGAPLTFRDLKGMPKFHAKFRATDAYTSNAVGENIKLTAKPNHEGKTVDIYADEFKTGNVKDYKAYGLLKLPKMEAFELVIHRPIPQGAKIKKANIRREKWGEYTATLTVAFHTSQPRIKNTAEAKAAVRAYLEEHLDLALGLDYAQQEGCVASGDAEAKENLDLLIAAAFGKQFRHMQARLAYLKRRLRKKQKPDHKNGVEASLSCRRLLRRIAKVESKVAMRRKDALEKLAKVLAGAFLLVAVEDIDLRAMAQGLKLGKNLMDNGFGMFRDMLCRKLTAQGKLYVVIDRWAATSQTCNNCGYQNKETKDLSVREWDCPDCGAHHDRDHNAADNIRDEGIRTLDNAAVFAKKKQAKATVLRYAPKKAKAGATSSLRALGE